MSWVNCSMKKSPGVTRERSESGDRVRYVPQNFIQEVVMLGEQLGEERGKITGHRVLRSGGGGPRVEVTFQATGKLSGSECSDIGTYWSAMPDTAGEG
jgi:hypothetical protein